jgi:Fe-S cluster assembly iron-binding protein IscA
MALDEPRENDKVFELGGLTYIVETSLLDQVSPMKVDFLDEGAHCGFSITTRLSQPGSCGPCSC